MTTMQLSFSAALYTHVQNLAARGIDGVPGKLYCKFTFACLHALPRRRKTNRNSLYIEIAHLVDVNRVYLRGCS